MGEKRELHEKIIQLRLKKRDLVLAGRNTTLVDEEIQNIEKKLDTVLQMKKA